MPSRRAVLKTTASGALVAVAGCVDQVSDSIPENASSGELLRQGDETPPELDDEAVERAGEVGQRVRESVVYLQTSLGGGVHASGTGFVYGDGSHVITNAHNVRGSETFDLWTVDGESYEAEVVDYVENRQPDVALVRAEGLDLDPLEAGSSDDLEAGQPLLQVGHPSIMGNWVITAGPMAEPSSVDPRLRTHVPGVQGNSGSPLLTLDGAVVGLTYGATRPGNRGPNDPPEGPQSDDAHTRIVGRLMSLHETIEDVDEQYETWV
ncbi:serine protease [Haladaptatus sp. GCM10025707]|uniref:S1 family peptidase n=1 Tax=unclassified Haladaptatus TaxID=2622732 RepID=UPI0023E7F1E7|nr:serine protease [Haladaptatus sp. QDMS2]